MSPLTLILREIRHRKIGFLCSALAVAVAVAAVACGEILMERDRVETARHLAAKGKDVQASVAAQEKQVAQAGFELEDAIRKHMTKLGFNILILPQEQDLAELHLNGTLTETMPETYVDKLANSNIVTVNHLLPMVTRRMNWLEQGLDVILVGTRGETPILHRTEKKPLLDAVAPGQMVIGNALHDAKQLNKGDKVEFLGREFTISEVHAPRGTVDDVTVWIDLAQAQELLGMQNLIHGILALECECAGDRISQIRSEIAGILPGTQVVERYSQAIARAEARAQAKVTAETSLAAAKADGKQLLERETASRKQIEEQHASLAGVLAPVILLAAVVWVGLLALLNVRQRREEIGILRAIGVSSRGVLAVFMGKAVLLGLLGAAAGVGIALAFAAGKGGAGIGVSQLAHAPAVWWTLVLAPVVAPVMASVASWLPALSAARQDPALVLQPE